MESDWRMGVLTTVVALLLVALAVRSLLQQWPQPSTLRVATLLSALVVLGLGVGTIVVKESPLSKDERTDE